MFRTLRVVRSCWSTSFDRPRRPYPSPADLGSTAAAATCIAIDVAVRLVICALGRSQAVAASRHHGTRDRMAGYRNARCVYLADGKRTRAHCVTGSVISWAGVVASRDIL